MLRLVDARRNPQDECFEYLTGASTADALDFIDLTFRFIYGLGDAPPDIQDEMHSMKLQDPMSAIAELNRRFLEHNIGYEFVKGEIIPFKSKYIHAEVVRPALQLLSDAGQGFAGPLEEFFKAHEHHRKGEQKDAVAWALKAFESTLKAICTARGWPINSGDTAKSLLDKVFDNCTFA